jgi:hypothetical protein
VQVLRRVQRALRARLNRAVVSDGAVSVNVEESVALDNAVKSVIAAAHSLTTERCLKTGLRRDFPDNRFGGALHLARSARPRVIECVRVACRADSRS